MHDYLVIDKAKSNTIMSSEHNDENIIETVDTNKCRVGNCLISGAFDPCNAIVAKLTTGEYAMYHAGNGYKGVVGVGETAIAARKFFESIKNQITSHRFIFLKKILRQRMLVKRLNSQLHYRLLWALL